MKSILVYCTKKASCNHVANFLTQNGLQSKPYHAGKTDEERNYVQKCFISGQIKVLVCTIAFSMGIDKSDVEAVVHFDIPKSIENYVQEIGRAGRDGRVARCHVFVSNDDYY